MEVSKEKKWFAIYTKPRWEKKVNSRLLEKGIDSWCPVQKKMSQWSDRKKWVDEPFIKSYLFVRIAEHEQAEVLMTRGIARFIYFGGKIAPMPTGRSMTLGC